MVRHPPWKLLVSRMSNRRLLTDVGPGDGEQEATQLMHQHQAPLLVTDDPQAYDAALTRNIPVTRTLRVLEMAAERGFLDLPTIVTRLRAAGFYTPEDVVEKMLARDVEHKRQQSENQEQG